MMMMMTIIEPRGLEPADVELWVQVQFDHFRTSTYI